MSGSPRAADDQVITCTVVGNSHALAPLEMTQDGHLRGGITEADASGEHEETLAALSSWPGGSSRWEKNFFGWVSSRPSAAHLCVAS